MAEVCVYHDTKGSVAGSVAAGIEFGPFLSWEYISAEQLGSVHSDGI